MFAKTNVFIKDNSFIKPQFLTIMDLGANHVAC